MTIYYDERGKSHRLDSEDLRDDADPIAEVIALAIGVAFLSGIGFCIGLMVF